MAEWVATLTSRSPIKVAQIFFPQCHRFHNRTFCFIPRRPTTNNQPNKQTTDGCNDTTCGTYNVRCTPQVYHQEFEFFPKLMVFGIPLNLCAYTISLACISICPRSTNTWLICLLLTIFVFIRHLSNNRVGRGSVS